MVLGVVCGLRKEYTTIGNWLKAWVRSTLIWFWYTWNVPCIFALRSYMFKNWCFKNKLSPEYSVYNPVSLCVLLDNICFEEHGPDATRMNLFICRDTQRQFSENICSEVDLRSRIFGTIVVKFLACLPLLGFSNI